jgi:hypothetical protein
MILHLSAQLSARTDWRSDRHAPRTCPKLARAIFIFCMHRGCCQTLINGRNRCETHIGSPIADTIAQIDKQQIEACQGGLRANFKHGESHRIATCLRCKFLTFFASSRWTWTATWTVLTLESMAPEENASLEENVDCRSDLSPCAQSAERPRVSGPWWRYDISLSLARYRNGTQWRQSQAGASGELARGICHGRTGQTIQAFSRAKRESSACRESIRPMIQDFLRLLSSG